MPRQALHQWDKHRLHVYNLETNPVTKGVMEQLHHKAHCLHCPHVCPSPVRNRQRRDLDKTERSRFHGTNKVKCDICDRTHSFGFLKNCCLSLRQDYPARLCGWSLLSAISMRNAHANMGPKWSDWGRHTSNGAKLGKQWCLSICPNG